MPAAPEADEEPMSRPPYRPDLRPMLLLGAVLVIVVAGWIVLSPLLLPPR